MRSVIDILDLSVQELDELISTALDIIENPKYKVGGCPDSFFGGDATLLVENKDTV